MSIMRKIYNGKIYPCEQVVSESGDYREALHNLDSLLSQLEIKLDADTFAMIDDALNIYSEISDYQQFEFFRFGLSMGMELTREASKILHK